jgi:general secretion pathway protein K
VRMIHAREDDRGVILIALLWILTIISVIALSFARETFVEVAAARNARDLTDAYYIARAGMASTIYQLMQKKYLPQRAPADQLALEADPVDLGRVLGQFGDGEYEVEIQDESGKINVNAGEIALPQLKALTEVIGIPKPDADIIVDAILDWIDVDKVPHANGAEDDYYQTLRPPYLAKNKPMSVLEELLLVRGVTPDYYFGHREKTADGQIIERYGLSRYLTAHLPSVIGSRINVNSAPLPVLLSIPGLSPGAAQTIVERRQVRPFRDLGEINRDLGPSLGNALGYISAQLPSTPIAAVYTLVASAHRGNSKVRRIIRAIVKIDPNDPNNRYKIIYWNENVPN